MTTDTKLAEVMAQLRAALDAGPTPGPWTVDDGYIHGESMRRVDRYVAWTGPYEGDEPESVFGEIDANEAFIAAANPEAIGTLLTALETAQTENHWLRRTICAQKHGGLAYMDDGEAQWNGPGPVDYLRASPEEIEAAWRLQALEAAQRQSVEREGWQWVPKEPTEEMVAASFFCTKPTDTKLAEVMDRVKAAVIPDERDAERRFFVPLRATVRNEDLKFILSELEQRRRTE